VSTYCSLLEDLVQAKDIQEMWYRRVAEKDRVAAGAAVREFIRQNGYFHSNSHLPDDKWNRAYFSFPSFTSSKLKGPGLGRLYNFFFRPKQVIVNYQFE